MGEKIAIGFHACVDFELKWDQTKLEELIRSYDIREEELTTELFIDSERQLLLTALGHMRAGMGAEFIPEREQICWEFAQRFAYKITIGGTAARAAIAISKLGYKSVLSSVCYNHHIRDMLPKDIRHYSNVGETHEEIYPHVVFSYPAGVHIQVNDIDFVTPRENRMMFSRDLDSLNMVISPGFASLIGDAEVMLISCFSEVLDEAVLKERLSQLDRLLDALPEKAYVVCEDGCYIKKEFRIYVHKALRKRANALSMNEDEMQEYIGERIDMMDPKKVLEALQYIYDRIEIPLLIVHSAAWTIAYGKDASSMGHVLEGGTTLASVRFRYGDAYGVKEYERTAELAVRQDSLLFGRQITQMSDREICCVPSKDLSFVKEPVVVGLGDSFAGGLLPELTLEKRMKK